jgi:hypothetical protein
MVDLIEKKNPEAAVNQQFQDLFSGDNRSTNIVFA